MKNFTYVFLAAALFALASCSTKTESKKTSRYRCSSDIKGEINYPKLKGYRLDIQPIIPDRPYLAGQDAVINFKLQNTGKKRIIIREWMKNESDNIRIYYRPWQEGISKFDPRQRGWICIKPQLFGKPERMSLELDTNNSVFLKTKLPFIKDINAYMLKGKSLKFLIVGELNLESVSAVSKPAAIEVR